MGNQLLQMTDKELARTAACGDRVVFDEIVRRYCQPLTVFAAAKTDTVQDAEDIVQETFLRALQNINSFNSLYSLKSWLFTIAYRLIVSNYRKRKPQRLSAETAAQLATDESGTQQSQWIWQTARELGTEAFTALWLRYKQEMNTSEIAAVMKKTKIMVRVLLHRSRKQLAKKIAEQPDIPEHAQWIRNRTAILERAK
ncbi:MAG: sigma-70 family RNA polymerase sigma factor [Sedimentisphaerales bacterium]|nr:sigma-70 family RNA polymerase sigma factor [Sedimentisphaerales bacterium]